MRWKVNAVMIAKALEIRAILFFLMFLHLLLPIQGSYLKGSYYKLLTVLITVDWVDWVIFRNQPNIC